jgi:hypothetical protein
MQDNTGHFWILLLFSKAKMETQVDGTKPCVLRSVQLTEVKQAAAIRRRIHKHVARLKASECVALVLHRINN